jgi:hypothetical protein
MAETASADDVRPVLANLEYHVVEHCNLTCKRCGHFHSQFYCPFLGKSKLYVCALPPTAHYYNAKFGRSIPDDPGIDIYDPRLDGTTILKLLETPIETCRYCACQYESHRWERITLHRAEDYEVARCDSSC